MGEKISFIDLFGTELEIEDEYAREQLADESAARAEDVAVLSARMDTFTALPSGSTAGDAELADARVGYDGTVYPNVGDAVRGQAFKPSNVSYKTRTGYISSGGMHTDPGDTTNEVYTNKIPVNAGDQISATFEWADATSQKWVAYATFDENGRFIERVILIPSGAITKQTEIVTIPTGASYIAFTWRSFGDCTVTILYKGSLFDIRNKAAKGLLYESIDGGFDTALKVNGAEVLALGFGVLTDFYEIQDNQALSIEKIADYPETITRQIAWFDVNKTFMSSSSMGNITDLSPLATPPAGARYARVFFAGSGGSVAPTYAPLPSTIRTCFNIQVIEIKSEYLTPIIGGEYQYPTFDTTNNTLTMPYDCILFKNGKAYVHRGEIIHEPTVVDLNAISTSAKKVYYVISTNNFEVLAWNTNLSIDQEKDRILVCTVRWSLVPYKVSVSIACPYVLDGKLYGIDTTPEVTFNFSEVTWAFNENVKGINHRGFNTAPENTLPAYKLSKKQGFKYVECDVSMTSDRVPVLLHDDTINRTARNSDGTEISDTISIGSITYAEALEYDFGIYKSTEYAGTPIPTFEQFILLCRNLGLHPYIELKSGGGYTEAEIHALVDIVKNYGMEGKVSWISFSSTLLQYVKNYDGSARLGFVVGTITTENITTASGLKTTDNEVFLDCSSLPAELKDDCIAAGIPIEMWTINSISGITSLDPYVTGVTSDNLIASKVLYEANKD